MKHPAYRSRLQNLCATGLLLAAVASLYGLAQAEDTNPKKDKKDKKADTPARALKPTGPMTLKMTIVSSGSDVAEVSKIIDEKLEAEWKANNIMPSHFIDDYEFIRRASLDIIGRVAKPEEIARYLKDPPDKRRSLLIDRLLTHEDYARHWANMWTNWLLTRAGVFGRGKYHDQMNGWLKDQFASNRPISEIVTKLITARGKNSENGAVNFLLAHVGENTPNARVKEEGQFEMVPATSRIARIFLGTQIQCAQCHPHPFSNGLKQEMFWGVNGFLRQVKREGQPPNPNMNNAMMTPADLTLIDDPTVNPDANVFFELRSGKIKMWNAEFLPPPGKERGPRLDPKKTGIERREELARYVIEHEMFSKAMVNRTWALFFGRGFVNPIDDFNDNNQPSNPELLNTLAERFKHYGYDHHKLIRWITHSQAYHRSYVANPSNDKPEHEVLFSRMVMKSLSPEQLFESLVTSTQAEAGEDPKKRKELRDRWLGSLVTNFGDDEGNEVTFNGTIVQALLMMNGRDINEAISRPGKGTVATAMNKKGANLNSVVTDLFLATLNRPPRKQELADIQKKLPLKAGTKDDLKAAYEDLLWALLNSNEYLLNH
ncbi:MAG: DUF1549 domain-containing protein [Gemmataceae bacterium]